MRLVEFALLLDENIQPEVALFLLDAGFNVRRLGRHETGIADADIVEMAAAENRVVVTHDRDS